MTGLVIPDAGTIGSASDNDALAISSGGVVTASQSIAVDTISEKTSANGVTIDGVNIKDSQVPASAGGSLVLLGTSSSTSDPATISFENTFTDTSYLTYKIVGFFYTQTDTADFRVQFGYGGGSTGWHTSNNRMMGGAWKYNGSTDVSEHVYNTGNALNLTNAGSASTDAGIYLEFDILRPYEATRFKTARFLVQLFQGNNYATSNIGTWTNVDGTHGAKAVTAIKFFASSGGINGEARVYGIKGS